MRKSIEFQSKLNRLYIYMDTRLQLTDLSKEISQLEYFPNVFFSRNKNINKIHFLLLRGKQ